MVRSTLPCLESSRFFANRLLFAISWSFTAQISWVELFRKTFSTDPEPSISVVHKNMFQFYKIQKIEVYELMRISESVLKVVTIYMIPSSARLFESNSFLFLDFLSLRSKNKLGYWDWSKNLHFFFRVAIFDLNRLREIIFSFFLRSNSSLFSRNEFSRMTVVTVINRKSKINRW